MSDHVFCNDHLVVVLAIMHLKLEADKVGQNGCGAGLRSYRGDFVALLLWPDNREAVRWVMTRYS